MASLQGGKWEKLVRKMVWKHHRYTSAYRNKRQYSLEGSEKWATSFHLNPTKSPKAAFFSLLFQSSTPGSHCCSQAHNPLSLHIKVFISSLPLCGALICLSFVKLFYAVRIASNIDSKLLKIRILSLHIEALVFSLFACTWMVCEYEQQIAEDPNLYRLLTNLHIKALVFSPFVCMWVVYDCWDWLVQA